jgi:hypothetical protein
MDIAWMNTYSKTTIKPQDIIDGYSNKELQEIL